MNFKNYHIAESIEDVVTLMTKSKKNIILGGNHWLKMGDANYQTAIDISNLGLDTITETGDTLEIGGHVSLRQLETSPLILEYAPIVAEAISSIVGVQFRNTARVGASVYSRFAFSDVSSALLSLDAHVEIDGSKQVSIQEYQEMPRERHFVTKIIITKEDLSHAYFTMRHNSSSLPYMNMAMTKSQDDQWRISIGARPAKPMLALETMCLLNESDSQDIERLSKTLIKEAGFHGDQYASEAFRKHLSKVFLERGVSRLCG